MHVGIIGLGNMGQAIAGRLLVAGHRLTVYNRTPEKAQPLVARGAELVASPEQAARSEVVITMLSDDNAVEAVAFGSDGILQALASDAIHVSMSTISVDLSDRLAGAHAERKQAYVAATVLGRPDAAARGQLFILAAGPETSTARVAPLLDALGQRVFNISEQQSQANLAKLSINFLLAALIEALGEAIALVRKGGIDPHGYVDLLMNSVFPAPVYKLYGALIADEKYAPAGFKLALGYKDMRLLLAAAATLTVPMPIASLVHDHFFAGIAQGKQDLDWSALAGIVTSADLAQPRRISDLSGSQ